MDNKKIIVNIFSNWTNLVITVLIAFFVSPIIVHSLGNENYGIWTLIVSITGYFTVLDFGINTALVRFISMYKAQRNNELAKEIYSSSFVFFSIISVVVILFTAILAFFFKDLFNIQSLSNSYLYFVFFVVGADIALSLILSVFLGSLKAVQEFLMINVISITVNIIKNIILVIMLLNGYELLTLAIIQITVTVFRSLFQYMLIRRKHGYLRFQLSYCKISTLRQIFSYSIYSFIISVVMKMLFYTDSIVIGSLISVKEIVFYAIPVTLLIYLEQLVYAMTSVLTPVVSSNDAIGKREINKEIYTNGTKYSLMISLPIIFVLYTNGDKFISIWMGEEYGIRSALVLKILLIGYVFSLSQLVANSVLKGVSKHKVFAYILVLEAIANLLISIMLAKKYGIEGIAIGTTIPLIIVNFILVPLYTCRVLQINFGRYIWESYSKPFFVMSFFLLAYYFYPIKIINYFQLFLYSFSVLLFFAIISLSYILEKHHKDWFFNGIKSRLL